MEDKKLLLLYHAGSGKGKIKNNLSDIINLAVGQGYTVTVRPTQCKGDATEYVKLHGREYDRIICSGGDGTLVETVSGLFEAKLSCPIGYIPAGSTNDFAGSIGIPKNPLKAAQIALGERIMQCDVGKFNGNLFTYVAAFGAFTDISYGTSQKYKNVFGHGAYVMEGIKTVGLGDFPAYEMTVHAGDRIIRDEFIYGMILNSYSIGGVKYLPMPDIKLDDGQFEVFLIKYPESPGELNYILTSLAAKEIDPDFFYYFKTNSLEIHSEKEVPWTLDGENGGCRNHVKIEIMKQALSIYIPEEKRRTHMNKQE